MSLSFEERPDPSTMRTLAIGIPSSVSTFRTTAAPPAEVPWPCEAPSCFRTSSAVKLSLQLSM